MSITEIAINGAAIDLTNVEYNVQVTHGRSDIKSQPEASTAAIRLRGATGTGVDVGDDITIDAYNERRFAGNVTDLAMSHLDTTPPTPVVQVQAVGYLSKLGTLTTDGAAYTPETVRERVAEVMDATTLDYFNGADQLLDLAANADPGINPVLSYLQTLAEWSGGTYFDDPTGRIVFEDYGDRGVAANPGIWNNQAGTFAANTGAWNTYPSSNAAPSIPAGAIAWSPEWAKNFQTIVNDIEVEYDGGSIYQQDDSGSIADFGRRTYKLTTELAASADAQERANQILTAQAQPLWNLGQITVLVDKLTTGQRDALLELMNGARVIVNGLPAGSPYTQFQGIVEGWSETYVPGRHLLTLSLSDPRASYQVATWGEVDAALEWGQVNSTLEFYNVVKPDDLLAA